MNRKLAELTRRYVNAQGAHDWRSVADSLDDDLVFRLGEIERGKEDYLKILQRLELIWLGNCVKRIFAEGSEACVLYDFLSDTPAGAVACVEWLRFRGGRIREIDFLLEREKWGIVEQEMAQRSKGQAALKSGTNPDAGQHEGAVQQ